MKSILTNTVKITVAPYLRFSALRLSSWTLQFLSALLQFFRCSLLKKKPCAQPLPAFLPLQWRKWISAMAMDSVLISHFLSFGKTGPAEIKYVFCILKMQFHLYIFPKYKVLKLIKDYLNKKIQYC